MMDMKVPKITRGLTLEYMYQYWATSVADACAVDSLPKYTWGHDQIT